MNEKRKGLPSEEIRQRMAKIGHSAHGQEEADGWVLGTEKNEATKENPSLVDYEVLPEGEREQNRQQVRDIPGKLAGVGCTIVRTRESEPPFVFPPDVLERLASLEHALDASEGSERISLWGKNGERTPATSVDAAWTKGDLSPYEGFVDSLGDEELSQEEKEKDGRRDPGDCADFERGRLYHRRDENKTVDLKRTEHAGMELRK